MLNRRHFLALSGATALGACSAFNTVVPVYVAAIQAIGKEAVSVMPELQSAASALHVTIPTNVPTYVNALISVAVGLGNAATASQGQDVLTQVETYINTLAPLVVPIITAANPAAGAALGLIVAALPAIEALVNMAVTELTALAQGLAKDAPLPAPTTSMRVPGAEVLSRADIAQPYLDLLLAKHRS